MSGWRKQISLVIIAPTKAIAVIGSYKSIVCLGNIRDTRINP